MHAAVAALAAPRCSEASRGAVLEVLESVLDLGEDAADAVLRPHTAPLLGSLRGLVAAAATRGGGGGGGGGGRKRGAAAGKARGPGVCPLLQMLLHVLLHVFVKSLTPQYKSETCSQCLLVTYCSMSHIRQDRLLCVACNCF
jgi:hypothetical protein